MTRKGGNSWNVLSKAEAIKYGAALFAIGYLASFICGRLFGWR